MRQLLWRQLLLRQRLMMIVMAMTAASISVGSGSALADEVTVAVASNFAAPMKVIAAAFERDTGHQAKLSFGGTGQFYAQIKHGAPFDVLLAADAKTPAKLEDEGMAVTGTRFTYAIGKLVLWSKTPDLVDANGDVLRTGLFNKIAVANPKLAPYGAAATEVIAKLGLTQTLRAKTVEGANIGQTFQFVSSGNAELGFVALSQVFADGRLKEGSAWVVPSKDYTPIKQDAVLLRRGQQNLAAKALLQYMQGENAKVMIESFGYAR